MRSVVVPIDGSGHIILRSTQNAAKLHVGAAEEYFVLTGNVKVERQWYQPQPTWLDVDTNHYRVAMSRCAAGHRRAGDTLTAGSIWIGGCSHAGVRHGNRAEHTVRLISETGRIEQRRDRLTSAQRPGMLSVPPLVTMS
jgi:hypothetical protein